jgi:TP901 family phage tail tape measure protein
MPPGADQTAVLSIIIRARNEATAALRSASADVSGLQATMVTAGRVMITTGAAMGVALAAGLAATVGPAMQFEQTMSGVGAVSGATAAQMKQLSTLALQLGKDTVFSASEAGQAIEELAKGGVGLSDILNGAAAATVNLAAAGQVSLPQAATIAANAMNIFSISGQQMAHVADMIAGAANASSLEVGDFAYSLQYAGAYARSAGLSFDELAVAIAEMGRQGITGSSAGTQLADFLARLQPRAGLALRTMEQLGLVTKQGGNAFIDASGRLKNLADIQQILQDATAGLTDAQRAHDLQLIFGMQGQQAANILLRAGAAGYNEMAAAMGKVTAQGVANARLNNLAGDLTNLSGSLETLRIQLGEGFGGGAGMPLFREMAQSINTVVGSMIAWTQAHGPLLARLMPLVAVVGAVTAAALTLGGAFTLIAATINPVALAIAGIIVAIGALSAAWATNWNGMRAVVTDVAAAVAGFVPPLRLVGAALLEVGVGFAVWRVGVAAITAYRVANEALVLAILAVRIGLIQQAIAAGIARVAMLGSAIAAGVLTAASLIARGATLVWAAATAALAFALEAARGGGLLFAAQAVALAVAAGIVRTATLAWMAAQWLLNAAMDANPLGLVIIAIAALTAGIVWAYQNVGGFHDALNGLWAFLSGTFIGGIGNVAHAIGDILGGAITWAYDRLRDFLDLLSHVPGVSLVIPPLPPLTPPAPTALFGTGTPPAGGPAQQQATRELQAAIDTTAAAGNPLSAGFTAQQQANQALQVAITATAAAGNPLTAAFQQQAAEQRVSAPTTLGTSTQPSAGSTQLLGGGGTTVNITVSVGTGAVQVQQGAGPQAETQTRDYGLKVGEQIADALAQFARAERAIITPPRPQAGGARG